MTRSNLGTEKAVASGDGIIGGAMGRLRGLFLLLVGLLGVSGVSGAASAADTLTLRLRFEGATPGSPAVQLEQAQRGDYGLTQTPLDAVERARSWWLQSLDARGKVLFRTPVRNHGWRRLEAFDPRSGRILEVREIPVFRGTFEVSLPYDPRISRVVLRTGEGRPGGGPSIELRRRQLDTMLANRARAPKASQPIPAKATLIENGSPATHLDLVLIGDGYTAAEMDKWANDAQRVANTMMADPLFTAHRRRFNIRRVDVVSAQSGVDEPDNGIYRDTALDATFNCANIDRLLCANGGKVLDAVGAALQPDARDVIVVVANSTRYGGSGGWFAAISLHQQTTELALHELGHTLFGLADEYDYGTCNTSSEPSAGNVSLVATRQVKWGGMIATGTAVPTSPGQYPNGTVGVFKGGQYCDSGKYRPTEDSKMRTLGRPWHAVNETLATTVFARYPGNGKPRIRMVQPGNPVAAP